MLLRIVVGFHFFMEGTTKLKSGTFSSYGFLSSAKGPLAPYFKQMLDDHDGMERLCVSVETTDSGPKYEINPDLTLALWDDFLDIANQYYGFGSVELEEELRKRRKILADKIQTARQENDSTVDTSELETLRAKYESDILRIQKQPEYAKRIFQQHKEQLLDWLDQNRIELLSHFGTTNRLEGFERDGKNKKLAATYVDSLREQVEWIESDRKKKVYGWTSEVTGMWDSLEAQINALAVDQQVEDRGPYKMFRHFDQEASFVKVVDSVIPWFDTVVGVLLIIGLFTRFASLAAAIFLISVILTQPPWVPGTAPTYFYFIELMALLVIFATCAGRMGGLDFFFAPTKKQPILETQS